MSRTQRTVFMPATVALVGVALAFGSVAAQDASPGAMDGMDSMDETEHVDQGLIVRHPWTRTSMMVDLANAAYLVIHNSTDFDDSLVGASSPVADVVEIHQTSMDEDGAMVMAPASEVPIPAHADAVLEPGGFHLMLIELTAPLEEGSQIEVTLEFANAEPQVVMVPVQSSAPDGDMDMDGMDMEDDMEDMDSEDGDMDDMGDDMDESDD